MIAEIVCTLFDSSNSTTASMRPRSIDRGNQDAPETIAMLAAASMRPRSIDRGNHSTSECLGEQLIASMRPRSIDRGNDAKNLMLISKYASFNEAAIN